ncbi:MAG: enoyl-CoA hydratase-related protein, partial [Pedobacter sp.]|nr:enoyl-CoA hydratase-related protein [Pedobacter sp.]
DMISAEKAERIGLVNYVVLPTEVMGKAEEILNKIKMRGPLAVAAAIRAVNAAGAVAVDGFEVEIEEFGQCFGTADFKEGVTAFLEKRKADFKGA